MLDKGCAPDILCLSETHGEKNLFYFENYKRFCGTHKINTYGGVCMYVKSNFSPEQIKDEKYIFDSNYFVGKAKIGFKHKYRGRRCL